MMTKTIHQILFDAKKNESNKIVNLCLNSWKGLRDHGFQIKVWQEEETLSLITRKYPAALDAFTHARNLSEASDIARYLIVHNKGGYYIDWDVQLLSPSKFIEIHKKNSSGILLMDPSNGCISSEVFSSQKGNDLLLNIVQNIVDIYHSGKMESMNSPLYSGPWRITEVVQRYQGNIAQNILLVKDVFAYDYSEIRIKPKREITQSMMHYWIHSWIN